MAVRYSRQALLAYAPVKATTNTLAFVNSQQWMMLASTLLMGMTSPRLSLTGTLPINLSSFDYLKYEYLAKD